MKTIINGKYDRISFNEKRQAEITFLIENRLHNKYIDDLEKGNVYRLQITDVKSLRSLQQNKFMWALLRELSKRTGENDIDLYVKLLKETNNKFEYLAIPEKSINFLRSQFRAVEIIKPITIDNGKELIGVKVYEGSSKFNVKEMNNLLDVLITWCEVENINTQLYSYE